MRKLLTGAAISLATGATLYKATTTLTREALYRTSVEKEDLSYLDETIIHLKNHKGLVLVGHFIEKEDANMTLVMLHDMNKDASSLVEEMKYFDTVMNANILLLDAASHGMSDGYLRGLGYDDVFDLMLWNKYLVKKYGDDHKIVMYGKGMGASTILNTAGLGKLKNVACIISDGAYKDVKTYLGDMISKDVHIPSSTIAPIIRIVVLNETGRNIYDMDTAKYVETNTIPTIFIHSKKDKTVDVKNVFALYNANASEKELFVIKEDRFYDMNQDDEYALVLSQFIKEHIA